MNKFTFRYWDGLEENFYRELLSSIISSNRIFSHSMASPGDLTVQWTTGIKIIRQIDFYPKSKFSTRIDTFQNNTTFTFDEKLSCVLSKMKEALDESAP